MRFRPDFRLKLHLNVVSSMMMSTFGSCLYFHTLLKCVCTMICKVGRTFSASSIVTNPFFPPSLFFNPLDFWIPFTPAVLRDPANHRHRAQHRGSQRSDPQRGVCPGCVRAPVPQQRAVCVGVPGLTSATVVQELNYFLLHRQYFYCELLFLTLLGHFDTFSSNEIMFLHTVNCTVI